MNLNLDLNNMAIHLSGTLLAALDACRGDFCWPDDHPVEPARRRQRHRRAGHRRRQTHGHQHCQPHRDGARATLLQRPTAWLWKSPSSGVGASARASRGTGGEPASDPLLSPRKDWKPWSVTVWSFKAGCFIYWTIFKSPEPWAVCKVIFRSFINIKVMVINLVRQLYVCANVQFVDPKYKRRDMVINVACSVTKTKCSSTYLTLPPAISNTCSIAAAFILSPSRRKRFYWDHLHVALFWNHVPTQINWTLSNAGWLWELVWETRLQWNKLIKITLLL